MITRACLTCILFLAAGHVAPAKAQEKPSCLTATSDSLWHGLGEVYHACEVDTPAKRKGGDPRLELDPRQIQTETTCQRVTLAFVVDTLGAAELPTIRTLASDHLQVEAAVRQTVAALKYTPARRGDRAVRQIVEYSRFVATPQRVAFTARQMGRAAPPPVTDLPRPSPKGC